MDISSLFSNPTVLIILAVMAMMLFGGGTTNITELLLTLLRSLKLIPDTTPKVSEQLYSKYSKKSWHLLQAGRAEEAKALLDKGLAETKQAVEQEDLIAPQGIMDTIQEWLKSPMFLIILVVGAFILFGGMGNGCKQPTPAPQESETAIEAEPASMSAAVSSGLLKFAIWNPAGEGGDSPAFRDPTEYGVEVVRDSDLVERAEKTADAWWLPDFRWLWSQETGNESAVCRCGGDRDRAACTGVAEAETTLCAWRGRPLRRIVSAPVRAWKVVRPLRRVGSVLGVLRPRNWGCGCGR